MRNAESLSQDQIREFLQSSQPIEFAGCGRNEKYAWVESVLKAQNYGGVSKRGRGGVGGHAGKGTGGGAAPTTPFIRAVLGPRGVRGAPHPRHRFPTRVPPAGIAPA